MLRHKIRNLFLVTMLLTGFPSVSWALTVPNPNPAAFGPDIGGSGLFSHGDRVLGFELYDFAENLLGAGSGFEFGFYFGSDPTTLIPIFEANDNSSSPTLQRAMVDFTTGEVVDRDESLLQGNFTTSVEDIGFFLQHSNSGITLFSEAALNPLGGEDLAAAFPEIGFLDGFLIGFAVPDQGGVTAWAYSLVYPISPSPVPIPGAAGLWLLGMTGLALFRRRVSRAST
jgi:hypothetical protein